MAHNFSPINFKKLFAKATNQSYFNKKISNLIKKKYLFFELHLEQKKISSFSHRHIEHFFFLILINFFFSSCNNNFIILHHQYHQRPILTRQGYSREYFH